MIDIQTAMRRKLYLFPICCFLCIVSCNNKKKAIDAETIQDVEDTAVVNSVFNQQDSLSKHLYSNCYRIPEVFEGSTPFTPTEEEIAIMKTPAGGSYSVLRFNVNYFPDINSRIVGYVKNDSSDIRLLWINYDQELKPVYVQEISQLAGYGIYSFSLNTETMLMRLEYEESNIKRFYRLENNGKFRLLGTPEIYNVKGCDVMKSDFSVGTELTIFSPDCGLYREDDNACSWVTAVSESTHEYDRIKRCAPDGGHFYFAIEGRKKCTILPPAEDIPFDAGQHEKLREEIVSVYMEDDATASFISPDMDISKIEHNGNVYNIYKLYTSFRYGNYTWFFATVNGNTDKIYFLGAAPGTISNMAIYSLGEHLFLYMRTSWYSADNDSCSCVEMFYLGPEVCFDISWYNSLMDCVGGGDDSPW